MKPAIRLVLAAGILVCTPAARAQDKTLHLEELDFKTPGLEEKLRKSDLKITRQIDYDICYPATAKEYAALGKHAVLMLTASSEDADELPLSAVYITQGGTRLALTQIAQDGKKVDAASGKIVQHSFYLLPIRHMKRDGALEADFTGNRTGFRMISFSAQAGLAPEAPRFARNDRNDTPGEPDSDALAALLVREYADYFP